MFQLSNLRWSVWVMKVTPWVTLIGLWTCTQQPPGSRAAWPWSASCSSLRASSRNSIWASGKPSGIESEPPASLPSSRPVTKKHKTDLLIVRLSAKWEIRSEWASVSQTSSSSDSFSFWSRRKFNIQADASIKNFSRQKLLFGLGKWDRRITKSLFRRWMLSSQFFWGNCGPTLYLIASVLKICRKEIFTNYRTMSV